MRFIESPFHQEKGKAQSHRIKVSSYARGSAWIVRTRYHEEGATTRNFRLFVYNSSYRASSRDRLAARRPCKETDPSKKRSSVSVLSLKFVKEVNLFHRVRLVGE